MRQSEGIKEKGGSYCFIQCISQEAFTKISIPQALLEFGKKGAIAMEQLRENLIGLENNDQLVTKRPNSEVNGALSLARVQSSKKK